jgi:MinD-like ATPase involved in chromosome partitioning or flagellar assembly
MVKKTRSVVALSERTLEDVMQHETADIVPPARGLAFQAAEKGAPMVVVRPDSLAAMQFRTIAEHLAQV